MDWNEYVKEVKKTESCDWDRIDRRLLECGRAIHALLGINTEQAELDNTLKRYIYYGKNLDIINIREEIGDMLWYLAILCDEYGFSLDKIMEINIAKLRKRYGEKFTEEAALKRDLPGERKILEGGKIELESFSVINREDNSLSFKALETALNTREFKKPSFLTDCKDCIHPRNDDSIVWDCGDCERNKK